MDRRLALGMDVRRLVFNLPVLSGFFQTAFPKGLVVLDGARLGSTVDVDCAFTS